MADKNNEPKLNKRLNHLLIAAVIAFTVVLGIYIGNFYSHTISRDAADWGPFGDYLGGVLNPIFSFLALIGLLYTIKLQAQEMAETREELAKTAKSQEEQSIIFNQQQFETTFTSLLELHNKALEKIHINVRSKIFCYLKPIPNIIQEGLETYISTAPDYSREDLQNLVFFREEILDQHENLAGYFRMLYKILQYIALYIPGSKLNENNFIEENISNEPLLEKEKFYSSIVHSFIPGEILQLLAVFCSKVENSSEQENFSKLRGLLCRYTFLENMQFYYVSRFRYGQDNFQQDYKEWEMEEKIEFLLFKTIPSLKKAYGNNTHNSKSRNLNHAKYKRNQFELYLAQLEKTNNEKSKQQRMYLDHLNKSIEAAESFFK